MTHLNLYLVTVVVFLALDAVWLRLVAMPLFRRHVGGLLLDKPDLKVAAIFYALYCVALVYFAAAPAAADGAAWRAFVDGGLIGLTAYGTYEATNMSTLRGWRWSMVVSDTLWGGFLSGVAAASAVALAG